MINSARLTSEFMRQAAIDSPSYQEAGMAAYLKQRFEQLGATIEFDNAGALIGSNSNNLIARLPGTREGEPFLICVHMDTVSPAVNVQPVFDGGVFTSAGQTVLGADDKAGITELIEAIDVLQEQNIPYPPLEIAVTICEEQGLLGAKQLDFTRFKAKQGVALDTTGIDRVINRSPAANRFTIDIFGLEAHAGVCPEQGLSAIAIASKAIARMPLGRIDAETTANIGTISGGVATNIVPGKVSLRGEVRSHNLNKLREVTETIIRCVEEEVQKISVNLGDDIKQSTMSFEIREDFPAMQIAEDAPIVQLIVTAGQALDRPQQICAAGGGSDASIFNGAGIAMVILGTGMEKVHTLDEQVSLSDLEKVSALLVEILRRA